jgi:hypothetical protein
MSSDDEDPQNGYDLKGSTKLIGQLYPVLKAKDGEILDGVHRSEADGSWRSETLEQIDSEEKKAAARLIANFHRRRVSREEKTKLINSLAELYEKEGLKVNPVGSHKPNEIADKIAEVTGIHVQTVRRYLSDEFKNEAQGSGTLGKGFVSAEQAILSRIGSQQQDYGKRLIQRFKEEHEEELLQSPIFRAHVVSRLPQKRNSGTGIPIQDEQLPPNVVRGKDGLLYKRNKSKSKASENKCVIDPDAYYKVFIEECPNCICSRCPHADTCLERVRAGE